uniref:Uncharacterized protein n=1 Tax=Oryza glumipatula TaxID=40148 RepID=A0A0E0AUZ0_9ORYZ
MPSPALINMVWKKWILAPTKVVECDPSTINMFL